LKILEKEKQGAKALATGLDIRCLQQNQEQAQIVRTYIMITACRPVLRHFFYTIKYDRILVYTETVSIFCPS
jgi:hypothetical protein